MSIEFKSQLDSPLPAPVIDMVKRELTETCVWKLVRDSGGAFGFQQKDPSAQHDPLEQVSVVVGPDELYVAFHTGTRGQREEFLSCCRQTLARNGIDVRFEET